MHYYFDVLKKYTDFSGRARRKEFWMFLLISTIISLALTIIDNIVGLQFVVYTWPEHTITIETASGPAKEQFPPFELGYLWAAYFIAVLIPSIAVAVRRLHDTGRTGLWWWLWLICCIGSIVLIIFYVLPGTQGDNKYGPDPLQDS